MPVSLEDCLVIGISARALFDLRRENEIFERDGLQAYSDYQIAHEDELLEPGSGFSLVKALLRLNALSGKHMVEVIIMSRNSADTSLRVFSSIEHYGLDITRAVLSGGENLSRYLESFGVDLFLSADEEDVQNAVNAGFAAGIILKNEAAPIEYRPGTLKLKEEELIGGYAEVFRKDRSHSFRAEVSFDEYAGRKKDGTLNSQWSKKPATMIRKVAAVQALREAFPQSFVGMYVAEEMGASEPDYTAGDIIEPQIQAGIPQGNPSAELPGQESVPVEQPASRFVLRIGERRDEPVFKIVEAEGGLWKNTATESIKQYFYDRLASLPEDISGKILVIG